MHIPWCNSPNNDTATRPDANVRKAKGLTVVSLKNQVRKVCGYARRISPCQYRQSSRNVRYPRHCLSLGAQEKSKLSRTQGSTDFDFMYLACYADSTHSVEEYSQVTGLFLSMVGQNLSRFQSLTLRWSHYKLFQSSLFETRPESVMKWRSQMLSICCGMQN